MITTIKFDVTEEHIKTGQPARGANCAICKAIKDVLPVFIVTHEEIVFKNNYRVNTPEKALQFIRGYDLGVSKSENYGSTGEALHKHITCKPTTLEIRVDLDKIGMDYTELEEIIEDVQHITLKPVSC